jgi:hypothetical protein
MSRHYFGGRVGSKPIDVVDKVLSGNLQEDPDRPTNHVNQAYSQAHQILGRLALDDTYRAFNAGLRGASGRKPQMSEEKRLKLEAAAKNVHIPTTYVPPIRHYPTKRTWY